MKIQITLNQETVTENGRIVPAGTWEAEYNGANGVHGYDSSDMDKYDALRLNVGLIDRAISDAEDNDKGQFILEGFGTRKEKTCSVKLFTART